MKDEIGGFGPNRQFSALGAEAVHAEAESEKNQIVARPLSGVSGF
jgi:hypothetical protein